MSTALALEVTPIQIATLTPQALSGVSLYLFDNETEKHTLYRSGDYPLTETDLQKLRERGIKTLFIDSRSKDAYTHYLKEIAFTDKEVDSSVKVGAVAEVIRSALQEAFQTADEERIVQSTRILSKVTANMVQSEDFTASDLLSVMHHDYGTFTHSANVAFYAGMLANELGYSTKEVEEIVMGGLLHDVGKVEIEEKILCKPEKLDDKELRSIKRHPVLGFTKLAHRRDLNLGQLMMVYQHHERLDGKGYPVGVDAAGIHPWAKLCSVVDIYEALTSNRPYRTAMPAEQALGILKQNEVKALEPDLVACWTNIIQKSSEQ